MLFVSPRDFYYYWVIGRLLLTGGNPYDPQQMSNYFISLGSLPGDWEFVQFNYPPIFLLFFIPFSYFSLETALLLWSLFSIFACSFITFLGVKWCIREYNPTKTTIFLMIVSAIFTWWLDFFWNQSCFLPFCGILGFLITNRKKPLISGILFSLLFIKPHLSLAFWVAVFTRKLIEREWRFFIGLVLALGFLLITTTILFPFLIPQCVERLPLILAASYTYMGISLIQLLSILYDVRWPILTLSLSLFCAVTGVIYGFKKRFSLLSFTGLIPLSILLSPHAMPHSIILAIPSLWYWLICTFKEDKQNHIAKVFITFWILTIISDGGGNPWINEMLAALLLILSARPLINILSKPKDTELKITDKF